jgi:hypothetical protein
LFKQAGSLLLVMGHFYYRSSRSRLTERRHALTSMWTTGFNSPWFDPLERFDIDSIGSR